MTPLKKRYTDQRHAHYTILSRYTHTNGLPQLTSPGLAVCRASTMRLTSVSAQFESLSRASCNAASASSVLP